MKIQEGDIFGSIILLIFYGLLFFILSIFDFFSWWIKILIVLIFTFYILQKMGVIFGANL
jgi:hypothetical protein